MPPKKSARVVGDVIGKFHPHGDTAVYEAMVRLAQDFSQRYPLVEGQGNFGNIDGDSAAAMRYTEARLTDVALLLLEGIDENAVDLRPTYDGSETEPVVLPAAFPNLLANGTNGIAVGMATSIPPHNVAEICDALRHLIRRRTRASKNWSSFMPGPIFRPAGELVESRESSSNPIAPVKARSACAPNGEGGSGRERGRSSSLQIPFQVQKSRLIEKMAELLQARKLPLLDDVVDEFRRRRARGVDTEEPQRRSRRVDGISSSTNVILKCASL